MPETTDNPMLNERFSRALALALELHHRQVRKRTDIPYAGHLMVVAGTVLEHGGDEEEAAAALLHDAVEDQGGEPTLERIRAACGERVAAIVAGCSDTLGVAEGKPPEAAPREERHASWVRRKAAYLDHLKRADDSVRLVCAADKLHNCRALVRDWRAQGDGMWARFNAGSADQVGFFRDFVAVLRTRSLPERMAPLVEELEDAVAELALLADRGGLAHALAICAVVHSSQRDKAGMPYALHPIRMMMTMASDEARIAALLHDVIEDAPGWSGERLRREGFDEAVIAAVESLTRREGEDYDAFIARASANPIARKVKLADLADNLDVRRLPGFDARSLERIAKYHRHWRALSALEAAESAARRSVTARPGS